MKRLQKIFLVLIMLQSAIPLARTQTEIVQHQQKLTRIVIDPGHGGHDPGAMGPHSVEKEITLAIAKKVGDLIKSEIPDLEVVYTRTNDSFVTLHRRAQIANENTADLFISIHCNANPNPRFRGAETYVMGLHKSTENLEVAKTENASILAEENYEDHYDGFNPDSDEDYIMLSMLQVANIQQSLDFSVLVQEKLNTVGGLRNRGVMQAGFVVLYLTTMPGVLIETGFLTNAEEEQFLLQKNNQQKIARSIVDAITAYKEEIEKIQPEPIEKEVVPIEPASPPVAEKIYRLWFASFDKPRPPNHHSFRNMPEVWSCSDEKGYHFTFEKSGDLEEIRQKLASHLEAGKIRKAYLRNAKIVEIEKDKIIRVIGEDYR